MARGVNKVTIIGNCCADPEVRYMPNGNAVTNINVATSESWKDKQTGQKVEKAEFHRIVFFNRLGEIAGEYLKKGSKIYLEGKLSTRKWQAQDGQDRYTTEIVASEMQMLDSRQQEQQNGYQQPAQQNRTPQQPRQSSAPANNSKQRSPHQNTPNSGDFSNNQQKNQQSAPPSFDEFDDDIPFFNPYKNIEYLV